MGQPSDDLYLDSVALNLHAFYTKTEGVLEKIASIIDGRIPEGENWHFQLLEQMSAELPSIRPAVISAHAKDGLHELRGFRHVARNIYPFDLDKAKLAHLIPELAKTNELLAQEFAAFAEFLKDADST